jgi:hypothetical protein
VDRPARFAQLYQQIGRVTLDADTRGDELDRFHRALGADALDPGLRITGNRLAHEGADAIADPEHARQFVDRIADAVAKPAAAADRTSPPLIFRRETAFRSNLLGNSVAEWGNGMAPAASFGPFLDEHGLKVWFDVFRPIRLVTFYLAGVTAPILRAPVRGTLTGRQSYRIEPGSVWIASDAIARTAALQGYYTGLTVKGGSLDLSQAATASGTQVAINAAATAVLRLDLDQPAPAHTAHAAGADALSSAVAMPKTLELRFQLHASTLTAGDAASTVFGCTTYFKRTGQAPTWAALISQILVPCSAETRTNAPDQFEVASSESNLCTVSGRATIDPGTTGWLLPAAKVDPLTVGAAAGVGAMCLGLHQGLSATWKDLKGGKTALLHPAVIVDPGLVTVIDFTASNVNGRQRWRLWRNAANAHASDITLTFGKAFAWVFISSIGDSEAVVCFCSHTARIDRPVDANGKPFAIRSANALASTLQTGSAFHAALFDADLLTDNGPEVFRQYSIALRNAVFTVGGPRSLALFGDLTDGRITKGFLALTHDIYQYLPTLPDPYVASYTTYRRDRAAGGVGRVQQTLTGFVKWPDRSPLAPDAPDPDDPRAFVYFRLTPPLPLIPPPPKPERRSFVNGVATFNQDLAGRAIGEAALVRPTATFADVTSAPAREDPTEVNDRINVAARSGELKTAVAAMNLNPLIGRMPNPLKQVTQTLDVALRSADAIRSADSLRSADAVRVADTFRARDVAGVADVSAASDVPDQRGPSLLSPRGSVGRDLLMLLDVSSRADQMGVTVGPALQVARDDRGDTKLTVAGGATASFAGLPLQIDSMDVVTAARYMRAATLPQISWEPLWNIPLPLEGMLPFNDTVTYTPGLFVYDNDGIPTRIFSESPYPVPIAPLPVTRHFLQEYHDKHTPRQLRSVFTLPFGIVAEADFTRKLANPEDRNTRLSFNMPHFAQLRGGLQIKARAPKVKPPARQSPKFPGGTIQLDNIKWFLFGLRLQGTTLGRTVFDIFDRRFNPFTGSDHSVPVEQIELSGYGASIFSNWLDADAAVADVSQTQFDVVVGRTAHEVVQVRSILYPFGVHVVRTITLLRSNNGYVFRSDSGWKAESDGKYDFAYRIAGEGVGPFDFASPYLFHQQPVKGVSHVREIRDFADAGPFTSSFGQTDPGLPFELRTLPFTDWQKLFNNLKSPADLLEVLMQPVHFDADVHLDNVTVGGTPAGSDFVVQSRKMLGYVQLSPSKIPVPARIFADLLNAQNGSLGGPVDCTIDIAASKQRMRVTRVDVSAANVPGGQPQFVTAARGSLILPQDGSWSVVTQQTNTGDVKPLSPQDLVPLIKPNANPNYLLASPADAVVAASNTHYGVIQSTGTQKMLFDVPQFTPNDFKLKSAQTYFADAYKLLNSKGVFPNVANALGLTNAERQVEILGEGVMKMADRTLTLDSLLPPTFEYPFIDEPGVLRVYAQYRNKQTNASGTLKLGIDSAAALADRWKAALGGLRIVVDLGPFPEIMYVDGNFNAASGVSTKYDKPHLQFGPVLDPVVKILQILATLSGEDFDRGMEVGMSNSADNWEYKFDCSKEIPVIRFPSPLQLTINPNPPLKLEAGLKIGFYFNEILSIPTDIKQLVPACGAYVEFYGRLQVQCFTLAVASVYAVGQVSLGLAADSKAGITLYMKFGFGAEVVVGLPVVANVSVLYMVEVEVSIAETKLHVAGLLLFRGSAEICGGLIAICIQIEAGGGIDRDEAAKQTTLTAQVTFSIDVCVLWVIDIEVTEHWQEQRQIA